MSLRARIALIVSVLTLLMASLALALHAHSTRAAIHEEITAANRVAAQLLNRTVWMVAAQGPAAMVGYLSGTGRIRANDIELIGLDGQRLYASPPSTYKAGRQAPPWFRRLIEPEPARQTITFPYGTLIVQSNASRASLDAWDDLLLIGLGTVACLLIANATLWWLVGRTTRPFERIVGALGQIEAGRLDAALPALPGREAHAIGQAFNRMVARLRETIEAERRAARAESQLSDSRAVSRWVDHQIEQERRAIARELHDEFGQSVTAIRSMATAIAQRARTLGEASTQTGAQAIADEAGRLYDAMHGIIPRLAPLTLDPLGLEAGVADLVERTQAAHPPLRIEHTLDLQAVQWSADASLAAYRAVQEGLTNAVQHSGADAVAVRIAEVDRSPALNDEPGPWLPTPPGGWTEIRVTDNGRGLPAHGAERPGHYGLRWLAERARALGGDCRVEPAGARGARLRMLLPTVLPEEAASPPPK